MNKYLIVRTSAIGDVVHTLPVLSLLRKFDPGCEIHWVVKPQPAKLLSDNPLLSKIFILKKNYFSLIRQLRKFRYKAVFDFQGLYRSAFLTRAVRAENYVGFSKSEIREKGAQFFYSRRITPDAHNSHVIFRGISVVCQYFNEDSKTFSESDSWQFEIPTDFVAEHFILKKLKDFENKKIVVLNPGAGWGNKQLAPSHFGQLADILHEKFKDSAFIVSIAPGEEEIGKQVVESAQNADISLFNIDLLQLTELIRKADLFIAGDTGPMQISAALGTPTLAIFGPTNPLRNGPFSKADMSCIAINKELDCLNCHKRKCPKYEAFPPPCMLIEPEKIADLALKRLNYI